MRGDSSVPNVGAMLGVTAGLLARPLVTSWWVGILIAVGVGGLGGYVISHGVNRIPGASPKGVAVLATVVIIAPPSVALVVLGSRLDTSIQAVVLLIASGVGFRLLVVTVDQFTPSFTVSLLAGLTGCVVFAAAVPLLAFAHPGLSVWACMGIAAGIGYAEGVLSGVALKPNFAG